MARPENEAELVLLARTCTGAHLARISAACARVTQDPLEARQRQDLHWHCDDNGDLVLSARLPAEVARSLLWAVHAAATELSQGSGPGPSEPASDQTAGSQGWAGRIDTVGAARVEVFAAVLQLAIAGAADPAAPVPPPEAVISVEASDLVPSGDRPAALGTEVARRLCCDATTATLLHDDRGSPIDLSRRRRTVNHALRTALHRRDHGCRFPGCARTRFVHAHHVVHWADGGATSLENIATLCSFHNRLLHEGGYSIAPRPGRTFEFRRPDGAVMADAPAGTSVQNAPAGTSAGIHAELPPARGSIEPLWAGERLNLSLAIDSILGAERLLARRLSAA